MDMKNIQSKVKQNMSEQRYEHTVRVVKEAVKLAKLYKIDPYEVELAALLHDYAKELSTKQMRQIIINSELPKDLLNYHPAIWHGPVGALLIKQEFDISNVDVVNAVKYHTTGRASMSMVEQVVFIADYIEPKRKFSGIDKIRKHSTKGLQQTLLLIIIQMIRYLILHKQKVYPDTLQAYNDLVSQEVS